MPFAASNCASPPVKFWIAPFVVAWGSSVSFGMSALTDVVVRARPHFRQRTGHGLLLFGQRRADIVD